MGFLLGLILLLLAMVADSSYDANSDSTVADFDLDSLQYSWASSTSVNRNYKVGEFVNEAEEMMMMDSEASRRIMASKRFISYSALKKNSIPCNRRGRSYYNCNQRGKANPYKRGCSYVTRCARYTD